MNQSPSSQTPILRGSGSLVDTLTTQLREENRMLREYISGLEDQLIALDTISTLPRQEGQRTYA